MFLNSLLSVLLVIMQTNSHIIEELFSYRSKHRSNILQRRSPNQHLGMACYECSNFPYEEDSLDELLGSCPGWRRSPKQYGVGSSGITTGSSLYDGCMTIILSNGSVISQNAIVFSQCLKYQSGTLPSTLFDIFRIASKIYCCKGSLCNGPDEIRTAIIKGLGINNIKVIQPNSVLISKYLLLYNNILKEQIDQLVLSIYINFRIRRFIIQESN